MPVLRKRKGSPVQTTLPGAAKRKTADGSATVAKGSAKSQGSGNASVVSIAAGAVIDLDTFGGHVETHEGTSVTLGQLVKQSTAGVVLFTYPKASTPGCTTQVCLFRDSYSSLQKAGFDIFGLSRDSPKSNTNFKTKQNLQYTLLCDKAASLIDAIGFKIGDKTRRGVFVVDTAGKVLAVKPGGPADTLKTVQELIKTRDTT